MEPPGAQWLHRGRRLPWLSLPAAWAGGPTALVAVAARDSAQTFNSY